MFYKTRLLFRSYRNNELVIKKKWCKIIIILGDTLRKHYMGLLNKSKLLNSKSPVQQADTCRSSLDMLQEQAQVRRV